MFLFITILINLFILINAILILIIMIIIIHLLFSNMLLTIIVLISLQSIGWAILQLWILHIELMLYYSLIKLILTFCYFNSIIFIIFVLFLIYTWCTICYFIHHFILIIPFISILWSLSFKLLYSRHFYYLFFKFIFFKYYYYGF